MLETTITVGIDLGTTNTLVCYQKKGKPKIIRIDGRDMVTSAIYVQEDGSIIVGRAAVNYGIVDPDNFIRSAKTYMGSGKTWKCRGRIFTPTDVATEVLKTVRAAVVKNQKCGDDATIQAVITVPAYFNSNQTEETRTAGERAGFQVLGIITEPMAAALYAAQDEELDERQRILVVDLGGGTFDLSALEADPLHHSYRAISTDGDNHLGGDDFDTGLLGYLVKYIKEDCGCDLSTLASSGLGEAEYHKVCGHLRQMAIQAKEELSGTEEARILWPDLMTFRGRPYDLSLLIERSEFYDTCQPLFEKIETRISHFLGRNAEEGKFQREDIAQVILAGGSCNIPKIQEDVVRLIGCPVTAERNLDRLVVYGASLFADYKAGGMDTLKIHDILSHSLGVCIVEDGAEILSKIIEKGEVYPLSHTQRYRTKRPGQTTADIRIYEAGPDAEDVRAIEAHDYYGLLSLTNLVPDPEQDGKPSIDVTFSYDESRCLTVSAEDIITHQKKIVKIDKNRQAPKKHDVPIDFVIMLDASGSMYWDNSMTDAKRACHMLIDELIDFRTQRLGLISFGSVAFVQSAITSDPTALSRSIDSIHENGSTNMVDAMNKMEQLFQASDGRKRIGIMVSDGAPDNKPETELLSRRLREEGIQMVFIGAGNDFSDLDIAEPENKYSIQNMNELEAKIRDVFDDIVAAN